MKEFADFFRYIYKGDKGAIHISNMLLNIAHTWDDIIDKDKPVSDKSVNQAFREAVFEIQQNPLWHQCGLSHHVLNCYLRWRDANTIEKSKEMTDNDLHKCYMLRAGIYDVFVIIAYYLYGDEWVEEVGPVVRRFYGETLEEYMTEMRNA